MKIKELVQLLNTKYDFNNQEEWDHCGVVYDINNFIEDEVNKVLVALDLTNTVIEYAIQNNFNVIITHHPIYVGELNEYNFEMNASKKINRLIQNKIAHISLHTCYDANEFGSSYQLFKIINESLYDNQLKSFPINHSKYAIGFSLISKIKLFNFLNKLKEKNIFSKLELANIFLFTEVQNIAVVAGSGFDEINNVISSDNKVDCLLTGDLKWHNYLDTIDIGFPIIDIGHNAEAYLLNDIADYLRQQVNLNALIEIYKPIKLLIY